MLDPKHYRGFVIWAFLSMGFFYVLLIRLALRVRRTPLRRAVFLLTLCACLSFCCAVFIPYLPNEFPRWAALHTACAAGSCVLLMGALLLLLLYWREKHLLVLWLGMVLICAVLFFTAGMVTCALEVFFVLSAEFLLRSLWISRTEHDL